MSRKTFAMLLPLLLLGVQIGAQEKAEKPAPPRLTALKLHVTFARFQGEKKVASVPYIVSLNSDNKPVALRMGTEVPIRMGQQGQPFTTVNYRSVGNNLDCTAEPVDETRFRIWCALEQAAVIEDERKGAPVSENPLFRSFKSNATLLLRDGQTAQHTMATDPLSGEILKVEVTLNVIK